MSRGHACEAAAAMVLRTWHHTSVQLSTGQLPRDSAHFTDVEVPLYCYRSILRHFEMRETLVWLIIILPLTHGTSHEDKHH